MLHFNPDTYTNNLRKIKKSSTFFAKQSMETPPFMSFLLTNRCTLRCKHCFNHENKTLDPFRPDGNEMSFEEYAKVSSSMGVILKTIFAGGEPFLRKDLHEIVHVFSVNNRVLNTDICTNGQDTEAVVSSAEKILKDNPHSLFSLAFSLDGYEEHHDIIRGKGTYGRCVQTWHQCKKLQVKYKNFDMYISTTINTINEMVMPKFITWCIKEFSPSMVALLKTRQHPRGGDALKNISLANYTECVANMEHEISMGNMGDVNRPQTYMPSTICNCVMETLERKKRAFRCFAGVYGGFVNYNGDVGVCEVLPPIANLKDYQYDYRKLWNDPQNAQLRAQSNEHYECSLCTHETEGIIPSLYFGDNWDKWFAPGNIRTEGTN